MNVLNCKFFVISPRALTVGFKSVMVALFLTLASAYAEAPREIPAIIDSVAHDQSHFTQGLFFDGKDLIETTGMYGASGLYRLEFNGKSLKVQDSTRLDNRYFGEGSIAVGDDIFYLTWKEGKAFVYNRKPFRLKGEHSIPTEGWGLTFWRDVLLMSNGSHQLVQLSPRNFSVQGIINVMDGTSAITMLNELELVGNTLYANIWQTELIAVIDLPSGKVQKYLDFSRKVSELRRKYPRMDVLNGIAYDGKNLWVTGKYWPWIYKLAVER